MKILTTCINYRVYFAIVIIKLLFTFESFAQVYEKLASFGSPGGITPTGTLTIGTDGHLYGTASGGSASAGIAFRMTSQGDITTIANFTGINGHSPKGGLINGTNGFFYGTTSI